MINENRRVRVELKWYIIRTDHQVGEEIAYTEDYHNAAEAGGYMGYSLDSGWDGNREYEVEYDTLPHIFEHKMSRDKYRYVIGFYDE